MGTIKENLEIKTLYSKKIYNFEGIDSLTVIDDAYCKFCDSIKDIQISKLKEENSFLKKQIKFLKEEILKMEMKTGLTEKPISLNQVKDAIIVTEDDRKLYDEVYNEFQDELDKKFEQSKISPIKYYRIKKGFTQKQIANLLKTSQPDVVRMERIGYKPNVSTLKKLAHILGVKIEDLIK